MKLGVIGGGAWGTALAQVAAAEGEPVRLWAREPEVVESINASHENAIFLQGVQLSEAIRATKRSSSVVLPMPASPVTNTIFGSPR